MRRIVGLYILREIAPVFFISLLVFTFILLMGKVLQLTELVVVRGIEATTIFKLLGLTIPMFLSMTIPLSTLLAVLMAFLRLTGDNELTVLKSAGVGLYQLLPPVILFCLWTYLLTAHLTLTLVPEANWAFRLELLDLAKARADVSLKERVFNTGFKNMVLFVNHMSMESDQMEDIFIQDERDPDVWSVIVASRGRIATDPERGALIFQLFDGAIDRVYASLQSTETIDFNRYELRLDLDDEMGNPALDQKGHSEYTTEELWEFIEKLKDRKHAHYPIYLMDAHKRLALPVACLVLGLIAVPLGVQFRARGRNWGVIMGIVVFLVYYVLLTAAKSFGESKLFPPALGIWMPNLLIGAATLYMVRQANRESPIGLIALINALLGWLKPAPREEEEEE
ncbi:MAG: LPS export ABC transporter permease LptF [Thermodesulfobacteriota bacterium]